MDILFDLHTHTIASGHAYSTLQENISAAKAAGLKAYGFSDHTQTLPGAPNNIWFDNFRVIPREIDGMLILGGAEANILDFDGNIDLEERRCKKLDYIIASMHPHCYTSGTAEVNTRALLKAMDNPYITIIGHPDDDRYPLIYDILVPAAAEKGVLLELNNSSLKPKSARINGLANARKMLICAKKYNARIVLGTDSHISFDIGRFDDAKKLIEEVDFPKELIVNTSLDIIKNRFSRKQDTDTDTDL